MTNRSLLNACLGLFSNSISSSIPCAFRTDMKFLAYDPQPCLIYSKKLQVVPLICDIKEGARDILSVV